MREQAVVINNLKLKCDKVDELSTRVVQMGHHLEQRKDPQTATSGENLDIAIYGLHTYNDVTASVNRLFVDMNVQNIECKFAYRTPSRPEIHRSGIVIAEMKSLRDKRILLERKRFIRNIPQYREVYIKSSKSHTEQVMNANFTMMLNEMSNGSLYYICDNGRIRRKSPDMHNEHQYNNVHSYNGRAMNHRDYNAHGGARPKTAVYNSKQKSSSSDSRYRGDRYASRYNNPYGMTHDTTRNTTHDATQNTIHGTDQNTKHTKNVTYEAANSKSEDYRQNDNNRPTINSNDYDLYSVQNHYDYHNYGMYTQQYLDRFANPQYNNRRMDVDCSVDETFSKN